MNKEKLIEEVRKYKFLYDTSDAKYGDINKKDQAWKSIAGVMSASESECKRIWTNLREGHRRAISKKRKTGSSRVWLFEEEMSFILPHMRKRKSRTSVIDDGRVDDNDEQEQEFDVNEMSSDDDTQSLTNVPQPQVNVINRRESSSSEHASTNTPFPYNVPKRNKKDNTEEDNSASAELLRYLLQEKKQNEEDEIDKFFSSIAATVKKLNTYNQCLLKAKIFNLVSEFELQEIQQQTYGGPSQQSAHIARPTGYNLNFVEPVVECTQSENPSANPIKIEQ